MIERFQEIKNVGTYKNAEQIATCGFNKTTIIFGNNSQGKSTFCDILKSLSYNDPLYIEKRKTIGETGNAKVEISFGNKLFAKYNNCQWTTSKDLLNDQKIIVFDTDFVQNNVFTNSTIERKNKENFTDFILGEDSIKIQKQLVEIKEINNKLIKDNDQKVKDIEKYTQISIEEFSKIELVEDIKENDTLCLGLQQQIANLTKNKDDIEKIKKLPLPISITFKEDIEDKYNEINNILSSQYKFSQEDILNNFNEHKKKINADNKNFDKWIREGYTLNSKEICPYCGNSLQGNKLVESYVVMFCENFIQYTKDVERLQNIKTSTSQFDELKNIINSNLIKIKDLTPKIFDASISSIHRDIEDLSYCLLQEIEDIINIKHKIDKQVESCIDLKLKNKYESIKKVDIAGYQDIKKKINDIIINYNTKLEEYNKHSAEYIGNLTIESINANIANLEKEYTENINIFNRNKYNDKYEEYLKNLVKIKENEKKSKKLKNDFETTQSSFIGKFFTDINTYYDRLGSRNFIIEQETTKQGIKKIYTVKLKYKNKEIEDLRFVLSDSDKRALALSIFLSKLKNEDNLDKFIIVMDDPITSFDNERMSLFINILKEFDKANQIIVLTHYADFYKKLVELLYAVKPLPSLLKIQHLSTTNKIVKIDRQSDTLLMDDFEEALYNMYAFIQSESHTYSSNDARTIMQKYLEYRFYCEIKEKNINSIKFEEFLKGLKDNNFINEDIFTRLNNKREEYNVNSHVFDNDSEDAKRESIIDLQKLLSSI
jgi:wobble nucleotide-excising tRNase